MLEMIYVNTQIISGAGRAPNLLIKLAPQTRVTRVASPQIMSDPGGSARAAQRRREARHSPSLVETTASPVV